MRLLITNGVQQGRVLRLKAGVNRIGRSVDNHFQIPDPSVSSVHCEVIYSDSGVMVRDLHSTNGTCIAGEPVQEGMVPPGQLLQLGNLELRLEAPPQTNEGVPVHIPEISVEHLAVSSTLPDGSLGCANHPELAARYRCTVCGQALCTSCVRVVRRIAGDSMVFCSLCAGQCELIVLPTNPEATLAAPKKSFLDRLTGTLKLPFKRSS